MAFNYDFWTPIFCLLSHLSFILQSETTNLKENMTVKLSCTMKSKQIIYSVHNWILKNFLNQAPKQKGSC